MNFKFLIFNFKFLVIFLLIFGLVLPSFCPAQGVEQPKTIEEAESLGMKILTALPSAVKKVWQEEAWPFILKMWDWTKNIWDNYIGYRVENLWQKVLDLLGKEKPNLKEEFQKEKQEMQKDLWDRFKDLLK